MRLPGHSFCRAFFQGCYTVYVLVYGPGVSKESDCLVGERFRADLALLLMLGFQSWCCASVSFSRACINQ